MRNSSAGFIDRSTARRRRRSPSPPPALRRASTASTSYLFKSWMAGHQGVYASFRGLCPAMTVRRHFTDEKLVGFKNWFENVITSGPFFSVSARFSSHSGSVENAPHFFSRSAIDS